MDLFPVRLRSPILEDVFIYRTTLYCWTFGGRLRLYAVADVERAIHRASDLGRLYSYALFHSGGMGADAGQVAAWHDLRRLEAPTVPLDIDAEDIPYQEYRVGLEADALLDLLIFFDRMYLATDGGLFSLEPFDRDASGPLPALRRLADPCYSTSGGLGGVAASCGPKGLRLLLDEVHGSAHPAPPTRVAPVSVRAEIGAGTVVNHRTRADFEFLAGEVSDSPDGRLLTQVRPADVARSEKVAAAIGGEHVDSDLALWDQSRLVLFQAGTILSVSVMVDEASRRMNSVRTLGAYGAEQSVISATRVGRSFAVETEDAVVVVCGDGVALAETGPVISLRSYPRSRRYRRLVSATARGGLWLFAVDDQNMEPRNVDPEGY